MINPELGYSNESQTLIERMCRNGAGDRMPVEDYLLISEEG